ncbi:uncharacterized protein LOC141691158 [Apium graveolens]|uniref:uncharacterized protein LOC141691158 n=1 Tax=Apium graveolens TaxID=4045 RepID=UPI003D7A5CD9
MHSIYGKEQWKIPDRDTIKINVDAAIFKNENRFGHGFSARDYTGKLIEARSVCRFGRVKADLAEALAFKEVLSWVKTKQWNKVIIETDCIKVVQALRSSVSLVSTFGLFISDCKQLLHDIADAEFCFIKRSANRVAHCLARQSCLFPDRSITEMDASSEVVSLCSSDLLME